MWCGDPHAHFELHGPRHSFIPREISALSFSPLATTCTKFNYPLQRLLASRVSLKRLGA